MRGTGPAYAAVDLGTNNCRMLVARPTPRGFRVIDSFSRVVRLGEGLTGSGALNDDAIVRTIDALQICADKMRDKHVRQHRVVATEACRQARNTDAFVARVAEATGLEPEPISAEEEARLTMEGCAPLLDGQSPHALLFDIGGGSTELIWVRQSYAEGEPPEYVDSLSLPAGVVGLTETYGPADLNPEACHDLIAQMEASLAPFCERHGIAQEVAKGHVQMVGTSGTVTTLGALSLGLARYDRSRVDGLDIGFDRIAEISRRLADQDHLDRAATPCIGEDRADLVLAGCAVLGAICHRWPVGKLRVADRGIREGVLMRMMAERRH